MLVVSPTIDYIFKNHANKKESHRFHLNYLKINIKFLLTSSLAGKRAGIKSTKYGFKTRFGL